MILPRFVVLKGYFISKHYHFPNSAKNALSVKPDLHSTFPIISSKTFSLTEFRRNQS